MLRAGHGNEQHAFLVLFHTRQRLYSNLLDSDVKSKRRFLINFDTERRVKVMHMFLKLAAILAVSLLIASLVLVVEGFRQRQKAPEQSSPIGNLQSLSAEDINRKTLEAADAMRATQAERFLQRQH